MSNRKGILPCPAKFLKLTTEIVVSHASMSELTPHQWFKSVYNVLSSLEGGKFWRNSFLESRSCSEAFDSFENIVKAKYVVCLDAGRKLKTLKTICADS